jgi:hypothetical protein
LELNILAIELGCGYVARSFAGDPKQVVALMEGALAHRGTAGKMWDAAFPQPRYWQHQLEILQGEPLDVNLLDARIIEALRS